MSALGQLAETPAHALMGRCRRYLARFLDPPTSATTDDCCPQNWKGLAELMECFCSWQQIREIEMTQNPTMELLEQWTRTEGSTVAKLLHLLEKLGMYNITEDDLFKEIVMNDVMRYKRIQEEQKRQLLQEAQPVQDPKVNSTSTFNRTDHRTSQFQTTTTDEVKARGAAHYDAFVCFALYDLAFVHQMMQMLEGAHGLHLCIDGRKLLHGTSVQTVTAKLIEDRCSKMIVVLSSNFLESSEYDFQMSLTHSLSSGFRSKNVIPILKENCELPSILRNITRLDYTKYDQQSLNCFWARLASSLEVDV